MATTPADLVKTAVDQALDINDPAQRARAITGILGVIKNANATLKTTRQADVLKLRETLTLREVADQIGSSIPRVDQIAKGK